jgi:hypothetical protein
MRADHPSEVSERTSTQSALGFGIRSLTQFGTPVMTDETEVTLFRSSISGPRQHGQEYGDRDRDPYDSHLTSRVSRRDSERRSNATVRARRFGVAVLPARIQASEHADFSALVSVLVHHSSRARAVSGSVLPRRSSICPKVRTTLSAYRFARYSWSGAYLPGTLPVLRRAMPRSCSTAGASDVVESRAINCRRVIHLHMRGSVRLRHDDPGVHFAEIHADAAFTGARTYVNGGPVLRLTQAPLQLRLWLMTHWTLVARRRTVAGDPHLSPHSHLFLAKAGKKSSHPATLMRLAAGAGREAQERKSIVHR